MSFAGKSSNFAQAFVPPHDLDMERAVIGAILVSENAATEVAGIVSDTDFYSETHRIIYRAVRNLLSRNEPVDQMTISDELRSFNEFDKIGGRAYVFQLVESVPITANALHYARAVRDKSKLRAFLDALSIAERGVYEDPDDVAGFFDEAEQRIYSATEDMQTSGGAATLEDLAPGVLSDIQDILDNGKVDGVMSGFRDLDELTTGVRPGDLVIIAGRPSMGKTSMGIQYAHNAAKATGDSSYVFSLEMEKEKLTRRLVAHESGVPTTSMQDPETISPSLWPELARATAAVSKVPMEICDERAITVAGMRGRLRRHAARLRVKGQRLGLVMVDYLGLMSGGNRKHESRQQELEQITRQLKVMAGEFAVPVLLLAQLNRDCEDRNNKRPMLSDLRGSGSIEQDADLVAFLYRDEYYYGEDSEDRGEAEIIVAKHRNGPTGTRKLAWVDRLARFGSLARGIEERESA